MLTIPFRNTAEALNVGHAFAKLLNCTLDDVKCLRSRSTQQAVDAEEQIRKMIELDLGRPLQAFMPWTPVVGPGAAVDTEPMDYFRNGKFRTPLIIGTVSQETTIFIYEAFGKPMDKAQYELAVILICRLKNLGKIHQRYPIPSSGDLRPNIATIGDHYIFNCPNR
jgi:carboxylesterase type B